MKWLAFLILVAAPCLATVGAEPKADPPSPIRLPSAPPVPPTPIPLPSPLSPTVLTADLLYVIDSDVSCIVLTSPNGFVKVTPDTGPLKIRGKFVDGTGKYETRTYAGKFVYTIEAVDTGKCELIIVPEGAKTEKDILRRLLDCQVGPAPPVPGTYTITSSDGAPVPFSPNTSLDAAKVASDAYAKAHVGVTVTVKDDKGLTVYTILVPPPTTDPFDAGPGFRVMMVYDVKTLGTIPPGQRLALYSQDIRDYVNVKAVKDADGKTPSFRCVDSMTDVSNDSAVWQKAIKLPKSLPWIIVGDGKTGFSGPLPASVDETMTLIKKYGG